MRIRIIPFFCFRLFFLTKINYHQYYWRRLFTKPYQINLKKKKKKKKKKEKKRKRKKDDFSRRTLSLCLAQIDRWNRQLMHSVWKINKVCTYFCFFDAWKEEKMLLFSPTRALVDSNIF
jgi:hypothetical protein